MMDRALEVAVAAALRAGEVLRADFHRPGGPRGKVDKAEADTEAEHEIRARLQEAFPTWGYRGEETGTRKGERGQPIWLVDPNDGTRDYLVGRRGSSVSIGLLREGRPVLGVVYSIVYPDDAGDLFTWAEGTGAVQRGGRACEARLPSRLGREDVVLVSSHGDRDPAGNLRNVAPARYRSLVSIAHRLAVVASGEASAASALFAPGAWDFGAGDALVRAAGGAVVDQEGRPMVYDAEGESHSKRAFGGALEAGRVLAARPWDVGGEWGTERPARLRAGEAVSDAGRLSRAQGCLLGQIAGDNLGALVEFASAAEVRRLHPDGPRRLVDGGVWNLIAGQPTDDSEMALALARTIVDGDAYDPARSFEEYQRWLGSRPFDVGNTVRAALEGRPSRDSQANGSLMRASPLGIFAQGQGAAAAALVARRDSALTHPHPICGDATAAFVVALAHAIDRGDGPEGAYGAALDWARSASTEPGVRTALEAARDSAPQCDGAAKGWVLIALQNAFHALLHAPTIEEGLAATILRGGDTDTNAAIAGALLGAVHGRAAIPDQWRSMVLSCHSLPGFGRHPRPMAYWPADVYELAERLLLAGRRRADQ